MRRPVVNRFFIVSILVPTAILLLVGGSVRAHDAGVSIADGLRDDDRGRRIEFEHLWTYAAGG